jgi:hypothetical protein
VPNTEKPTGSARLELVEGVHLLHPEDAVFEAMLSGWGRQQQARQLQDRTIQARVSVIRTFFRFADTYPWAWTASLGDEWSADLVSRQGLSVSSMRNYQQALRLFSTWSSAWSKNLCSSSRVNGRRRGSASKSVRCAAVFHSWQHRAGWVPNRSSHTAGQS